MKERSNFCESYYDHGCSVVPEQDVLQTDIIGKGRFTNLKRWWYGLFLLSYTNNRSRVYYNSSHSIRVDRIKQYRHYQGRIHPLSIFRNFWECLLVCAMTVNQVLFHHNTSLLFGQLSLSFYYIAAILDIIVILDLFVNFKTGYIDKETKQIVLDANRGMMRYCSTKLFAHCASAMPLQLIMLFRYGTDIPCVRCKSNKFICALKVLAIFRLYRIYEASSYWNRDRGSFKVTHFWSFIRIGVLGIVTMLHYKDMCETVCLYLIIKTGHINKDSQYGKLLFLRFGGPNPPSNATFFCHIFSRICKSLLLFNHGFASTDLDKITTIVACFIAKIFYFWTVIECYTLISRMKFSEDQVLLNKATSMNLMKCRQLPDTFSSKVMQYHNFKINIYNNIEKQNGLYEFLPKILKTEALLSCYERRVARLAYFSDWPPAIIKQIVDLLEVDTYLPGSIVNEAWVQGDGLIIIDVGVMAVYSDNNEEMGHLIDGDYFGEISLVTDKELHTSSVIAITDCKILLLPKYSFRKLMRHHEHLFFKLKRQLEEKYISRKSSSTLLGPVGSDAQIAVSAKFAGRTE